MSKSELIVMLTHNDYTIANALAVFTACKDTPAKYWGAKEQGLPREELKQLFSVIKESGKYAVLEVVSYDEESCLAGAQLAIECGCDLLLGTVYFDSVNQLCHENHLKYFPFVGQVSNRPSILGGTLEEILQDAEDFVRNGVDGFDLLGYRYCGDRCNLCRTFVHESKVPVCLAGSINSYERLEEVKAYSPAYFTIGGAFWEHRFGDDIPAAIESVCRYMNDGSVI